MKLFHWDNCEFNEQFAGGDIIVIAETIEEARKKALKEGKKYMDEFYDYNPEKHKEKMNEFKNDISKEPKNKSVIFISGSS